MKRSVFTQKKVTSFLSTHFVPVVLDIDDDMLPEGFSFFAVPTFYIINEKGKLVDRVVGGANSTQFLEYLKTYVP